MFSLEINTSGLQSGISASYDLSNGSDNDGIIPELYWVQTAVMLEDIRWTLSNIPPVEFTFQGQHYPVCPTRLWKDNSN